MLLHWNVFTFAQKPLNKPVFSIAKIAMVEAMLHYKLSVKVKPRCISVWKEQWAKRLARVTLLVDFGDQFVIVMDKSNGFWFLPGGGVEQNESIEEAAKREALEELGLEMEINRVIKEFHITLISTKTKEQLIIPPFTLVHAIPIRGQLNAEYAPNRKIILVKKKDCRKLLHSFKIPIEYECMSPYYYVSKEVVRQLAICST